MSVFNLDLELAQKYSCPGPRYTSYPTALSFEDVEDSKPYVDYFKAGKGPLSIYVHLPFCSSQCWFCACNTKITRDQTQADIYLGFLRQEIERVAAVLDCSRPVVQLHFGGGTPNFLTPDQIRLLGSWLHRHFSFSEDAECSVELDPRTLDLDKVKAFREIGFNRASFGVQDCDEDIQKLIHREQPHKMNIKAMDWLRGEGFESVNIDLIYGLPLQTVSRFQTTLEKVLALEPDRFAVFNYAHVPWMKPHQNNLLRHASLPEASEKLAMLKCIVETITSSGFEYIGMDHFAREGDELAVARRARRLRRNFQGYSTRAGADIVALGVTAISQTEQSYHQNEKTLDAYYQRIREGRFPIAKGYQLSEDDRLRREVIMEIMCNFYLDICSVEDRYGIDFKTYFADALTGLDEMVADALVEVGERSIEVTSKGRFFVRNIAMAFDAYLVNTKDRHSKTV